MSSVEGLGLWFKICNKQVIGYKSITTEIRTVEKKKKKRNENTDNIYI